ncbi:MAG: GerMN domain-containing protein, partial [Oscillibacter sp.]|nr:GerMN domain-containing protein [Oscillibacter sp.]
LSACAGQRENQAEGYVLYFPEQSFTAGTGALRAVPAELEPGSEADSRAVAVRLVMELLNGPEQEDLRSAFPPGTSLRSLDVEGSRAVADFSGGYGTLSGVALTLADYSVALTLTQIPEISLVRITVRGQELSYRDRQSFTARDVLLEPETDVVGTIHALLYFPDGAGSLSPEERTLSLYEGETQVEAVTEAVEGGPEDRNLLAPFPEEFRVRSVWQEGDLCFVNLSSALLDTLPPGTDLSLCLRALDQSLASLENVREVRYLVDGEFVGEYDGVRLAEPYGETEGDQGGGPR